jgi:hypothetical protein
MDVHVPRLESKDKQCEGAFKARRDPISILTAAQIVAGDVLPARAAI